jgi:signal transduction histidine kinase
MGSDREKPSRHARPPKVLVVDDEEWMRDACGQILGQEGLQVMTADDGQTGLELASRNAPDLILVDLKMPGMDGIAYLGSVKALDPEVVAIVITGYATLEVAVEAMKAGAYDFLPKPFKPTELRAVVRRGVEHRSAALRASALLHGRAPAPELHLAMLAHQFKAPLAVLRQCVEVVLQGYAGDISARARGMIEIAAQRADQMMKFVDDWLVLSRLEQGKGIQEVKTVNVAELVRSAVERVRQQAAAEKLTIRPVVAADAGTIRADPDALDELLASILDNAVRYTPAGGSVTVAVDGTAEETRIAVRDTGPGISPEDMEHIFEPFYRGKAQKGIPGTGLGLPIARRIAEAHGGRIEVATAPGEGSEFRIYIPRSSAGEAGAPLAPKGS